MLVPHSPPPVFPPALSSGLHSVSLRSSDVAEVQVGLLDPPVGGNVLRLVALHVLLHGGQAGAVLQTDGALVRRRSVVGAQVLDHGRVVPGSLVAQLALEWLLTCVHAVVGLQLVLEAELLAAAVTFVGFLAGVDAFVALQRALVSETAATELALVRMVSGCVRAQVALERGVAGERSVALAADVAPDSGVHFHVLLQRRLSLEPLPTKQAEDGHV